MAEGQWSLKVKIVSLDQGAIDKKSKWVQGDTLTLQIESHGTVGMAKQRIGMIVRAHEKHQEMSFPEGTKLSDITKLQDIPGFANGSTLFVDVKVPREPEAPPVVLSDDEGLYVGEEAEPPAMASPEVRSKELTEEEQDKQGALKQEAAEALEDGDVGKAVEKQTEALMIGNVSAMMIAKRAEMLNKQKRYRAAVIDTTVALELNPDSAKAYRARGKARRFLGEYGDSAADFSQAQKIDFDDGVADLHDYVHKRHAKIQLKAKQDAKKAADAAEAAKAAEAAEAAGID